MEIKVSEEKGDLNVKPIGRLTSTTADELEAVLNENITDDINRLIFDFQLVDYISSKGIRVLVAMKHKLKEKPIFIVNTNYSVFEIFRLSGLLDVFRIS